LPEEFASDFFIWGSLSATGCAFHEFKLTFIFIQHSIALGQYSTSAEMLNFLALVLHNNDLSQNRNGNFIGLQAVLIESNQGECTSDIN